MNRNLFFLLLLSLTTIAFGAHQISLKRKELSTRELGLRSGLLNVLSNTVGYLPFRYGKIPLNSSRLQGDEIPITNFLDTQFFGEAKVGSRGQTLEIMFDTGSSNTFVLAPNCTGLGCYGRIVFKANESHTFYLNGTSIDLSYGSGNFSGYLGNDNIRLGEATISEMLFALIDKPDSYSYLYARFDGLAGLAFPSISVDHLPPFFEVMIEQGLVDDASFSFYLTKDVDQPGSALILGGVDEKYANSSFSYVNLTHDTFYMTDLDDFIIDGHSYTEGKMNIILDSGTSVIVGPVELVNKITALYPHSIRCEDVDSYPNLVFVIGGKRYEIPPGIYIIQNFYRCSLGIVGATFDAELQNTLILGDVFMRSYYTHFDYGNRRLGFAQAVNISNITTTTTASTAAKDTTVFTDDFTIMDFYY